MLLPCATKSLFQSMYGNLGKQKLTKMASVGTRAMVILSLPTAVVCLCDKQVRFDFFFILSRLVNRICYSGSYGVLGTVKGGPSTSPGADASIRHNESAQSRRL
jgi:hypothetical protein